MPGQLESAAKFKAFRINDEGGRINGRLVETTLDELSHGDVVIKAAYSSVNYKDALAATGAGKIIRRFPVIGGIDVAGTVERSHVPELRPGTGVIVTGYDMGVGHDGGYSEYVRVPAEWVIPLPATLGAFDAMALGTAGFTAALSIIELERNGLRPANGPVIVTGATGGVGSLAVACLARLGYQITALTGKDHEHEFLRSLGATSILSRRTLQMGTRPLEKALWAGAIDAAGGEILAWLTRTMMQGGAIASSGLTAGAELHTTVMPFILRGVKLLGIDSAMASRARREEAWGRLDGDLRPKNLGSIAREIGLADLATAFDTLLKGESKGRIVVRISDS